MTLCFIIVLELEFDCYLVTLSMWVRLNPVSDVFFCFSLSFRYFNLFRVIDYILNYETRYGRALVFFEWGRNWGLLTYLWTVNIYIEKISSFKFQSVTLYISNRSNARGYELDWLALEFKLLMHRTNGPYRMSSWNMV